jgi:hypothetical protein
MLVFLTVVSSSWPGLTGLQGRSKERAKADPTPFGKAKARQIHHFEEAFWWDGTRVSRLQPALCSDYSGQ